MAAVGRERQSPRNMPPGKLNPVDLLSGGEVAETHGAIFMTGYERAPVRADGQVSVVVRAEINPADLPAAVHVPDHQARIGAPGVTRDLSPARHTPARCGCGAGSPPPAPPSGSAAGAARPARPRTAAPSGPPAAATTPARPRRRRPCRPGPPRAAGGSPPAGAPGAPPP